MEDKETGRLEAFSDGVFAVAITLLVLNIKIPDKLPETSSWNILFDQWPSLVAYVTSFVTIGIMWLNHHRLFERIKRTDTGLMLLNLLLLLVIVFIPVPTALLAESFTNLNIHQPAVIYSATNMIMAICYNLLWRYASHHNRLLGKNVDPRFVRAISGQYLFGPLLYLVTIIVALFSTIACVILIFILALFFALPARALPQMPADRQPDAGRESGLEGEAQ